MHELIPVWQTLIVSVIAPAIMAVLGFVFLVITTRMNWAHQTKIAKNQDAQLKQIHALVNSSMTAEKQKTLKSLKAVLILLLEAVESKRALHLEPTAATMAAIAETKMEIADAELDLQHQIRQTQIADAENGMGG